MSETRKLSLPGVITLILVLLLVLGGLFFRSRTPATHPLTPTPRVVVLLVPSVSLSDLQDAPDRPILAALSSGAGASVGVFPNRLFWRVGDNKLTTLNTATSTDLVRACQQMGGEALGEAAKAAGVSSSALGGDPAARAFLGADDAPSVTAPALVYDNEDAESGWRKEAPDAVGGFVTDPTRLANAIAKATASATTPSLRVATFDDLLRCDSYAPLSRPESAAGQRRAALRRLETLLAQLVGAGPKALPSGTSLLVISPVPSMTGAERGEMLGPILLWQRADGALTASGVLLTSPSTRLTPGLLAPGDLVPTIRQLLGIPGAGGTGRSAVALKTGADYLSVRVAAWAAQFREIQFLVYLPWVLAGTLLLAGLLTNEKLRSACAVGIVTALVALLLAAPFAPREPGKEAVVYAIAGLLTLSASVGAALFAGRQGAGSVAILLRGVCLLTGAVVLLDTLTGGVLLARSPLSYSPVAAARFYGIGNEISGVFLGAALFAVGVFCPSPLGAALGGAAVALISGMPMFGADAGGFIAALISFGVLFVLLTVARSDNKRGALWKAGLGTGAVVLALLGLYVFASGHQSSATRTHVGEAVASAQAEGGGKALLPLIRRKAATGVRLLFTSPWSALLVTELGLCFWLLRRRRSQGDADSTQAVYLTGFVAAGALLLVNDSGVVAAATCLLYPTASLLLSQTPLFSEPKDTELGRANG